MVGVTVGTTTSRSTSSGTDLESATTEQPQFLLPKRNIMTAKEHPEVVSKYLKRDVLYWDQDEVHGVNLM